ncbi:hypothetical protein CROQUDRAFT_662581 [Cronartium quercuum f. sp. fusiforme G11]|uniref:Uncharacterized protein n=1 Tax=Cronartium quercuum f. sp. fusiforme G11 TaxID=708437 RepID=A0A9P6NEU0_9BASI|nr:hypothetical protein CROQUDRAFT_662581 [Cronartium quercuum f. sp. fusiforme G11]
MARSDLGRNPDMCVNVERDSDGSKEFQIDMSTDEGMYVDTSFDEDVEDDPNSNSCVDMSADLKY